jgi:adenylate/nucleoside-diphosphate kinase
VFDGFPENIQTFQLLESLGIKIHQVLELKGEDPEDESHALPELKKKEDFAQVINYFTKKYQNVLSIEAGWSSWLGKEKTVEKLREVITDEQVYIERKHRGQAIKIEAVKLDQEVLKARCSTWVDYCLVHFVDDNELHLNGPVSYIAEYKNTYHHFCDRDHLDRFIANPGKYHESILPELLPRQINSAQFKSMFPKQLELLGYCPVTLAEGPEGFQSIIEGDPELFILYADKIYTFRKMIQLQKFMK